MSSCPKPCCKATSTDMSVKIGKIGKENLARICEEFGNTFRSFQPFVALLTVLTTFFRFKVEIDFAQCYRAIAALVIDSFDGSCKR